MGTDPLDSKRGELLTLQYVRQISSKGSERLLELSLSRTSSNSPAFMARARIVIIWQTAVESCRNQPTKRSLPAFLYLCQGKEKKRAFLNFGLKKVAVNSS